MRHNSCGLLQRGFVMEVCVYFGILLVWNNMANVCDKSYYIKLRQATRRCLHTSVPPEKKLISHSPDRVSCAMAILKCSPVGNLGHISGLFFST